MERRERERECGEGQERERERAVPKRSPHAESLPSRSRNERRRGFDLALNISDLVVW